MEILQLFVFLQLQQQVKDPSQANHSSHLIIIIFIIIKADKLEVDILQFFSILCHNFYYLHIMFLECFSIDFTSSNINQFYFGYHHSNSMIIVFQASTYEVSLLQVSSFNHSFLKLNNQCYQETFILQIYLFIQAFQKDELNYLMSIILFRIL